MTPHILVIHRWRDAYAHYAEYLDHDTHHVTYVVTELGRVSVPPGAAAVRVVPATDDFDVVWPAVTELVERFGMPDRVVALNEGDLDCAARVRACLGCVGQDPDALARFRDKLTMVKTVASAGVRTPEFADAPDERSVVDFACRHRWPVIVKPRRGTASRGVLRLNSAADLATLRDLPWEPRVVQRFCPDPILHIDGFWTGERLGPWRASRYVNTCVGFTEGDVLGSVELDDESLLAALGEFTAAVGAALSREPWVFHLEAFLGTEPDGSPRLTFLETGYRVGGAEIPFVWREVHGIDLMRVAAEVQLGVRPVVEVPSAWRTAGWLLVPTPVPAPCRVESWELPEAPKPGDRPYAVVVRDIGEVIPKAGGYEHVGARIRFNGGGTGEVEKAILRTAAEFGLNCVPLATTGAVR
jgi:hypothetical protein